MHLIRYHPNSFALLASLAAESIDHVICRTTRYSPDYVRIAKGWAVLFGFNELRAHLVCFGRDWSAHRKGNRNTLGPLDGAMPADPVLRFFAALVNFTERGETIFDPSGTITLAYACKSLGRHYIGVTEEQRCAVENVVDVTPHTDTQAKDLIDASHNRS